jgi:hypothetical protein
MYIAESRALRKHKKKMLGRLCGTLQKSTSKKEIYLENLRRGRESIEDSAVKAALAPDGDIASAVKNVDYGKTYEMEQGFYLTEE